MLFDGRDVLRAQGEELRQHRGSGAALCFQNPRRALAPLRRVGHQIDDRLDAHHQGVGERPSAVDLLEQVGIRAAPKRVKSYPHELSGGMAQRVMFSLALACFPALIVADEPTTGLDVTLTRGILELLRRAARDENRAVLVISHDIAAIAQICDRIVVMYGGIVVEQGPAHSVLHSPAHPYTAALLDSVPDVTGGPRRTLPGVMPQFPSPPRACPFAARCPLAETACLAEVPATRKVGDRWSAACIHAGEPAVSAGPAAGEEAAAQTVGRAGTIVAEARDLEVVHGARFGHGGHRALRGVSVSVAAGETLGIVGESGCGKTTLARAMLGLVPASGGTVLFEGQDIAGLSRRRLLRTRRRMQLVAQDPIEALDPRRTVRQTLVDSLRLLDLSTAEGEERIAAVIEQVALDPSILQARRHEISGGQAQRVGIARALLMDPELVIFDEPTSALDVTVQAQILELIAEVMNRRPRAYIFVSHDLATVRAVSDRVVVLYLGTVVEEGDAKRLFARPLHPYTRALFAGIPSLRGDARSEGTVELARDLEDTGASEGCVLAARCPFVQPRCLTESQVLTEIEPGRRVACWRIPELP